MRSVLCAATIAAMTLCGGAALAQDEPTVAQIKAAEGDFTRGREAYKKENFTEAAEAFESADGHAANERVLELAILARDKAGTLDRAATLAQLAIERYPDSSRIQSLAEPLIARAHKETLSVSITCDEPCTLLDGTRIIHGQPATERLIFLTPGEHTIRAGWTHERALSQRVEGEAGASRAIRFAAPEIVEEPIQEPAVDTGTPIADSDRVEAPSGIRPLFFWIGAGVTAVLGGVTIWSGVDTLNNPGAEQVRVACVGLGTDCPEYQEGQSKERRTNILLGATGAAGVGTIVLGAFFTNWSGERSGRQGAASISPWLGVGQGATLGATGRF